MKSPVYNRDKDRVVYVLPETLKERADTYEKMPESELGHDKKVDPKGPRRRQVQLPEKPQKPHKPEIDRNPPPRPIKPPHPEREPLSPKEPTPVKPVTAPKLPEPSKPHKDKGLKRDFKAEEMAFRVVQRYTWTS